MKTHREKLLADLMLLQKIERNLFALNGSVALRMGRLIRGRILQAHNCATVAECTAKLYRELEKFR